MKTLPGITAPAKTYQSRRKALAASLHRPVALFAGLPRARNYATNGHPFRAGSSYLYFGGPPTAGAALIIDPGSDGIAGVTLVRSASTFDDAVWTGEGPDDAVLSAVSGLPESSMVSPEQLKERLGDRTAGYVAPPCPPTHEWIKTLGFQPADEVEMLAIINLRLIKDEHEMVALRRAADVGVEAHIAAMRATAPGRSEAEVAAELVAVFTANQCGLSFGAIVSVHGEVLHSEGYPGTLAAGNLLLVDAGAEEPGGYASDMTRTYPVNGTYTTIQRQLCATVLRAKEQAIAACTPGRRFRDIHDLAARVICEGLVEAELLRGDPDELTARGAHTLFFAHGLGHLIGLDVHDMEDFGDLAGYESGRERRPEFGNKFLRLDRDLAVGMTVTIEPGIYLVPQIWQNEELVAPFSDAVNRSNVDKLLADEFGGIRMEDTVRVRSAEQLGPENLTAALPSDLDAICELVGTK